MCILEVKYGFSFAARGELGKYLDGFKVGCSLYIVMQHWVCEMQVSEKHMDSFSTVITCGS